ncbi:MAG TPA: hypothetical protein VLH94_04435 [Spirochaetia bacterium]|nr:hypothetical protein [Spirochaetia bacterium]
MSDKVIFVDYQEPFSIKVGRSLLSKEYELADCCGKAINRLTGSDSLGILLNNRSAKPKTCLFGLIKKMPRRTFLGVIWFDNQPRHANENRWIFEIYGREYVDLAKQIAKELSSLFNVAITVHLISEQTACEKYLSDYGY